METRSRSPRPSSKVAPTMMLASGSASWQTRLAASSTSQRVMSRPPVMQSSRLLAPFSDTSSSSGLTIASSAAAMARCSPEASPMPIIARPMPPSTVRTSAVLVSGGYFAALGVGPELGRVLGEQDVVDAQPAASVMLSFDYWTTVFGADPDVLGKTLVVSSRPLEIVGVAPRGFVGTTPGQNPSKQRED